MDHARLYYSTGAVERFKNVERTVRNYTLYSVARKGFTTFGELEDFTTLPAAGDVMQSPMFGAWLDRILQAEQNSGLPPEQANALAAERAKYLGNYAVLAALNSGRAFETEALAHGGFVMVPELGRAAVRGAGNGLVRVVVDDGLTFTASGAQTHIPPDALAEESPLWQPLRRIGTPDFTVALNDIDPNRLDIFRYPVSPRLTTDEYQVWADTFAESWDFLQQHDPHLATLVRAHVTTIIPAPTEPLTHSKTMAAGASIGAISFNENRDPIRLLSQIAFGFRKDMALALRTAEPGIYPDEHMYDPVYPPSREGYGIAAHLQDDSFINVGLARFYHNLLTNGEPVMRDYYELSFARWYVESQQNLAAWRKSDYLQAGNGWLHNALQWEMHDLKRLYESLPEAPKQAIAAHCNDRYISWRLRTITPDPHAVAYLRDLWRSQRHCPFIEIPATLNQSNDAYVNEGQRRRYVLAEVRRKEPDVFAALQQGQYDPALFGKLNPGDIAFARGDISGAREYFANSIRQQPGSTEAWAGFSLTFLHDSTPVAQVLQRQPELAAAVYAAIGDSRLNPIDIAQWLVPSKTAQVCMGA